MEGEIMQIQYVLTQAEWDDVVNVSYEFTRILNELKKSNLYDHNLPPHEIVAELIEQNKELTSKLKETEQ